MEETRQHSAVTPEKIAFGAVWIAGPVMLFAGILGALAIGNRGIAVGLIGQATSRVVAATWAFVRPDAQITKLPIWTRFAAAALWAAIAIAVSRGAFA
jgi:hypothetical protein